MIISCVRRSITPVPAENPALFVNKRLWQDGQDLFQPHFSEDYWSFSIRNCTEVLNSCQIPVHY